jgi:transglutaminase-like putative cysteine protease
MLKYITLLLISLTVKAAETSVLSADYLAVEKIPKPLLENAHSVVRVNDFKFEIVNQKRTIFSMHKIITILNDEGDGDAFLTVFYDDLQKVRDMRATVYDKSGEEIDSYKEKDFMDVSSTSSGTLYDDNRVLYKDLSQKNYPYTVELTYEIVNDNLYFIPDYYLLSSYETSIENSSYQIVFPEELKPRYKAFKTKDGELQESVTDNVHSLTWSYKGVKAVKKEPFSVGVANLYPAVLFSPAKYNYEGYEGDFSTWDGMADFQAQLNSGLAGISEQTKAEVKQLTASLSPIEKVRAVYKYMQDKTRYISIQLGIGGFKPFSAENTDAMGYGDCKALTYYTQMLLKEVGIDAYYTWIYGGSNPPLIDKDFPNINFNHVILFVPLENDSIWLECTSQKVPAGYLGDFTGNRYGLVIKNEKAELVKTKSYDQVHDQVVYKAEVKLTDEGYAVVNQTVSLQGIGSNYMGAIWLHEKSAAEQEDWVRDFIDLADFKVNKFDIKTNWSPEPEVLCTIEYDIRNAFKNYGDYMMFQPNMIDPISVILKADDDRRSPIDFGSGRSYVLQVDFLPPTGYEFVEKSDSVKIKTQFGEYSYELAAKHDLVTYYRTFQTNESTFPKEDYEALRSFYKSIRMEEKKRIKLKKIGS